MAMEEGPFLTTIKILAAVVTALGLGGGSFFSGVQVQGQQTSQCEEAKVDLNVELASQLVRVMTKCQQELALCEKEEPQ